MTKHFEPPSIKAVALYRHFAKNGRLLYVGISSKAGERLAQHMKNSQWAARIAHVSWEWFPDRDSAEAAERKAIATEWPIWNTAHADEGPTLIDRVVRTRLIEDEEPDETETGETEAAEAEPAVDHGKPPASGIEWEGVAKEMVVVAEAAEAVMELSEDELAALDAETRAGLLETLAEQANVMVGLVALYASAKERLTS